MTVRSRVVRRGMIAVTAALCSAATAPRARAADDGAASAKVRCESSYEAAQRAKREEKLSKARVELGICRETCPRALAADCARWLEEVEALTPTLRVVVVDAAGAEVNDARVTVDGRTSGASNARSISVDPGAHVVRVEPAAGGAPVEVREEVHAGEREHVVRVELPPMRAAPPPAEPARPPASHTASWVLGGAGVAALIGAGALTLKGHLDRSELRSTCYPYCTEDQVRSIRTEWIVAGVLGGVGAVAIGAAVFFWPRSEKTVSIVVSPRAVALSWTLR